MHPPGSTLPGSSSQKIYFGLEQLYPSFFSRMELRPAYIISPVVAVPGANQIQICITSARLHPVVLEHTLGPQSNIHCCPVEMVSAEINVVFERTTLLLSQ